MALPFPMFNFLVFELNGRLCTCEKSIAALYLLDVSSEAGDRSRSARIIKRKGAAANDDDDSFR